MTIKTLLLNDLHLEYSEFPILPEHLENLDLVIAAGDIGVKLVGVKYLNRLSEQFFDLNIPILYILGNHEYYGAIYPNIKNEIVSNAGSEVIILDNSTFTIGETLFIGSTLWSNTSIATDESLYYVNDYRYISIQKESLSGTRIITKNISPRYIDALHYTAKNYIFSKIEELRDSYNKICIITHHAPSFKSIPKVDQFTPYFASDLTEQILNTDIDLWIHGHTHIPIEYKIRNTKIISKFGISDENIIKI